jgi:hydrogenase maturation protease
MCSLSDPLISVVAIGNRHRGDDGIGLRLLEAIQQDLPEDIQCLKWEDADALGIASELLELKHPVVLVDCADMQLPPGECRWFNHKDCRLGMHLQQLSTHGFGFAEALQLAQTLGFSQELWLFTIQPESVDLSASLSPTLNKQFAVLAQQLKQFILDYRAQNGAQCSAAGNHLGQAV